MRKTVLAFTLIVLTRIAAQPQSRAYDARVDYQKDQLRGLPNTLPVPKTRRQELGKQQQSLDLMKSRREV